jgi:oxygen-dependent protoporphyrinogen oxidase
LEPAKIGDPKPEIAMRRRIVIVGGGISGLAAAHRLVELGREGGFSFEVSLVEGSGRLGGVIDTERTRGFILEAGPDSFITEKPWALHLCERLGLAARLISTNSSHQSVYIARRGALYPLPQGFFLLAPTRYGPFIRTPLFSWRGKLRIACEPLVRRAGRGDESLASFVRRRFGQELLDRVAQPLVAGIYGADPEALSLAATMPRFLEMERAVGSVTRAMRAQARRRSRAVKAGSGPRWSLFVTLRGGLQELVDALASRLAAASVHLGVRAVQLEWNQSRKTWTVSGEDGQSFEAEGMILALPAYASAELLSQAAPELAGELRAVPYSSMATINLAYKAEEIPRALDAFGFVVPAVEERGIVACTFSSVKYEDRAPAGHVLLRAFAGGGLQRPSWEKADADLETAVREELAEILGIHAKPLLCRIHRHALSMPQYPVGHLERLRRIETRLADLPNLALAGNGYGGVGIADCIHSGEEAAERLWAELKQGSGA